MKSNHRQYPRSASYIIAQYRVNEGTFRDIIKNISASGLSVRTTRRVALGQPILIEFPLFKFDNIIRVFGKIARIDNFGFSVTFDQPIHGLICKEGHFPEIVHESDRPSSD